MTSLQRPDAVPPPDGLDAEVAWHYGQPFAEQRRLAAGDAVVDLSHLGVVAIEGPDRLSWLHDLTTAHLSNLGAGESRLALVLDPNGRVEMELHVVDDGATTWLIVESGAVEPLLHYLNSMRFMLRVEVADRTDDIAVVGAPLALGSSLGLPDGAAWRVPAEFSGRGEPTEAGQDVGGGAEKYVRERPGAFDVNQWLVPRAELMQILEAAPSLAGTWAWEAERVGAGVPRVARDADERTLPHELGLIGPAVHLDKGCYRGQETVARTHNMGRPPRRLVQLLFDQSEDLPEPGTHISLDGRRIGRLGSVVSHADLGPVSLGLVKRNVNLDAVLDVGERRTRQVEIVVRG